jgi:16S rRNA (adenine1518-N6/adenine1519-N6)-dimethyltransferase
MPKLKKSLGQHFLRDQSVLKQITAAIGDLKPWARVIEIGPGMGALTKHLVATKPENLFLIELDDHWAAYQRDQNPDMSARIIHQDFLQTDLSSIIAFPTHVVGNFPYNISSQIVFTIIDHRDTIMQMTGMFQKEVAQRLAAKPRTKDYSVLSVLTQAYYDPTYLFDVLPEAFDPPPKVMSGVIRLVRRTEPLHCNEVLFKKIVKQAFTQRRKTMRNSLKEMIVGMDIADDLVFNKRPEELEIKGFEALTNLLESKINK